MEFDSVMKEITGGLTGDRKKDISYLQAQMEKYRNHEFSREIIRECGRIMFGLLPEDTKEELSDVMEKTGPDIDALLEEVRFHIYKKDLEKANSVMEPLAEKIDLLSEAGVFQNDSVSEYYTFYETFEEVLFHELCRTEKDIRISAVPYADVYLQYGSLLVDLGQYEKANTVLEKAVRWNPVNAKIAFEYAETFKITGDLEKFFELTKEIFKYAFTPADVARCHRNLAFYFSEKKQWQEAMACCIISMQFDKSTGAAQAELDYIRQNCTGKLKEPSMKKMRTFSAKYGFPFGADNDVLGLAYAYGKHCLDEKQYAGAKYFFGILYALTGNEEIRETIDQMPLK